MPGRTPWRGQQSHGAREYTEQQARQVVALLREHVTGRRNAISNDDLYTAYIASLGISPRAFRAIVSDRDGQDFLIANAGDGRLYVCESADDGDETTRKLAARARTELRRVARRRAFAEKLGRLQPALIGDGS